MRLGTGFAIYFVIWWTVLFAIIPFGARSQSEAGEVVPGSEAAAPAHPHLRAKAIWTTVISLVIFAGLWGVLNSGLKLDDIPFFPKYQTH